MRAGRSVLLLALAVSVTGCHSTSVEVVRSLASFDFSCAEDKIQVTPAREKGTFRAEGCGKSGSYTCEGWDSYNQKPICAPSR